MDIKYVNIVSSADLIFCNLIATQLFLTNSWLTASSSNDCVNLMDSLSSPENAILGKSYLHTNNNTTKHINCLYDIHKRLVIAEYGATLLFNIHLSSHCNVSGRHESGFTNPLQGVYTNTIRC